MHNVILPSLGEGIHQAEVVAWHVKEGIAVAAGDDIVELVTDKATFNVQSPAQGTLKTIYVKEGQSAAIGAVLGIIE